MQLQIFYLNLFYLLHNSYSMQNFKYEHAAGNHNFKISGTNNITEFLSITLAQFTMSDVSNIYTVKHQMNFIWKLVCWMDIIHSGYFSFCGLLYNTVSTSDYITQNERMTYKWWTGRKQSWPNWGTLPAFSWTDWGKSLKSLFRIGDVAAEIQTKHLLSLEHYWYANPQGMVDIKM